MRCKIEPQSLRRDGSRILPLPIDGDCLARLLAGNLFCCWLAHLANSNGSKTPRASTLAGRGKLLWHVRNNNGWLPCWKLSSLPLHCSSAGRDLFSDTLRAGCQPASGVQQEKLQHDSEGAGRDMRSMTRIYGFTARRGNPRRSQRTSLPPSTLVPAHVPVHQDRSRPG